MLKAKNSHRIRGDIPNYSPCCNAPVLARAGAFYCHGCQQTLVNLADRARRKVLAALRWERRENAFAASISLYWRNLRVAYARNVPDFAWRDSRYEVVNATYKWVIGCSDADFGRVARALALDPPFDFGYPGRNEFPTLEAAADDLWAYLDSRDKGLIPHWRVVS